MNFHLFADERTLAAAKELSGLGLQFSENGIPVRVREKEGEIKLVYEAGELTVEAGRRQLFFALKTFSDTFCGNMPQEGYHMYLQPSFALTYMIDCSRNAVPEVGTLKELIRHLAVLGYDTLGLYMEDTFVVENQPYFGYLRTPYTRKDIREIDEYCLLFGIELVPYIQTLAHFNSLTRHYAMDYLFDYNDILLVGDERTYAFIEDLISTCASYFTSRRIHIGMDEAYMLGRGKYMDIHGFRNRFDIMEEHLVRVNEICKKYGLHPMMWSDMFFSLTMSGQYSAVLPEEIVNKIPSDIDLVYWDYCSSDEEHYAELLQKHSVFRNKIMFAGGAWKWLGYTPDNRYAIASCGAAGRACVKNGIRDFIVTGWGDNGADCSVFATLPALLYCARMNYGFYDTDEAFENSFFLLTGVPYQAFMSLDLGNRVTDNDDVEERNSANKYLLFNDVLLGTLDTITVEGLGIRYGGHSEKIAAAGEQAGRWRYLFDTQYALCRVLEIKADIGIKLRNAYQSGDREALLAAQTQLKKLPQRIEAFYRALRTQWERENRVNGFDVQDIRIGALKQRVAVAIEKVDAYLNGETDKISELNEHLLCFMGHGDDYEKDFDQCEWRWRRMSSVNVNE